MPTTANETTQLYSSFINALGGTSINLSTDHVYVALVNSTYSPNLGTDTFWSTVQSHEVSGFGYTAGGIQLTSTSWTGSVYSCASFSWSALTVSSLRYLVIYDKSTGSGPSSYRLVGYIDLGSAQNLVGQPLSVTLPGGVLLTLFSGVVVPSVVSANITDATTLGRQLITAADAPTARSALGVAGVPSAGMVKSTGSALTPAVSGTDYAPATTGSSLLKGNGSGGFSAASNTSDYVPWSGGTGGLLPATSGQKLTTQGGNTLDDGSGNTILRSIANPTGGTSLSTTQKPFLNQAGFFYGTLTSTGAANYLGFTDEVAAGNNGFFGFQVEQTVQTGAVGLRQAIKGHVNVLAAGTMTQAQAQFIGIGGRGEISVNLGGTDLSAANSIGAVWGDWSFAVLNSGATNMNGVTGHEVNITVASGATVRQRKGILIALAANDAVRGSNDDIAFNIANQTTVSNTWKNGILFGDNQAAPTTYGTTWPFASDSTIMGAATPGIAGNPCGTGIDFSNIGFTDCAIKTGPAPIQMGAMASAPATPASGKGKLYIASDGSLHFIGANGTDTKIASA